ncbi:MAG: nucleotidyltransferase family protein [Bacteroidota bacterium]
MIPDQYIRSKKKVLIPHAKKIAVFGSYERNEETEKSDLDLLVTFSNSPSLLDLIRMEQELSGLLGIKVDLITERSLTDKVRPYIERNLFPIL